MITPRIADSFLEDRPPWDSMLGDLSCVLIVWGEVIVVLIDDDDACRISETIALDLQEYSDMLATRKCE
jgi:hypothetical protein